MGHVEKKEKKKRRKKKGPNPSTGLGDGAKLHRAADTTRGSKGTFWQKGKGIGRKLVFHRELVTESSNSTNADNMRVFE